MQSGACSLYTLHSQQESEGCCDGFSRDPPVLAVCAWRAVYPYKCHTSYGPALLVVRLDVKVRGGDAERLHASCCHRVAAAEVDEGEHR
jgi:hypothetical protein